MTRPLTRITLFAGVPFDETYKHVVNWNSEEQLENYLAGFPHITEDVSRQNLNKPIRWDTGKQYRLRPSSQTDFISTFNQLTIFNYVKIDLMEHDHHAKTYYAFITNLEYYNDGTTFIYFSVDMWNTYKWGISWQNTRAMIQRGFVEEMNRKMTDWSAEFKRVKNMPDEIGGDGCQFLRLSHPVAFHKVEGSSTTYRPDTLVKFILFTAQPKDAEKESGSLLALYSQYLYYFIAYNPETKKLYNINVNGKKVSDHADKTIDEAYNALAKVKEFAGSDSLIVDSEIYNYLGLRFEVSGKNNDTINFTDKDVKMTEKSTYLVKIDSAYTEDFKPETGYATTDENYLPAGTNIFAQLAAWYQNKYGADAPLKIMGEPFSKIYFTDGKGIGLTTDLMKYTNLTTKYITLNRYGAISENGHESYTIAHYNRSSTHDQNKYVTYENALAIDDAARDTPIILDNYTMYLNANRNQLANTRANAKMNEKLAKRGNLISLQNTQRSLNTAQDVMAYQNGRRMGMARFDAATGVLMGGARGLMSGGLLGGLTGAVGGAINGGLNLYKTGYNNQTAANALAMQNATQAQNARANYAFQNEVATNNYEQTIRSQNAMLADTMNHNDQIAHQGSNYMVAAQNGNTELHWQLFTCQDSLMQNVILYFKLFGYEVNQYNQIDPWLHVKAVFNYVRTSNAYIVGTIPQDAQKTIAAMFDNGVTVWTSDKRGLDRFNKRDQDNVNPFNADNPFRDNG